MKVHYTGWLPDGTLFESTRKGGVPATLPYTDVIDGWKRGMIGMKPGGIRKLVIPPALAYGSQGKGSIPANSPLIFEIELVESVKNEPRAGDIPTLTDGTSPGDVDTGLKDMADGLKYRDLKVGDGPEITPQTQDVTVHYVGWLTDGLMFDSSRPRNEPLTIGLNNVIQGWKRGMIGMKAGGIRKLVIPAPLGYGSRGSGEIPPDATLVFEVELLSSK